MGVADVGADVGSVVDAGSAGTTVIGSASGGCDMMGAGECKRNMGQNQAERQKKKNKGTDVGRIFSKHTFSALRLDQEKKKRKINK